MSDHCDNVATLLLMLLLLLLLPTFPRSRAAHMSKTVPYHGCSTLAEFARKFFDDTAVSLSPMVLLGKKYHATSKDCCFNRPGPQVPMTWRRSGIGPLARPADQWMLLWLSNGNMYNCKCQGSQHPNCHYLWPTGLYAICFPDCGCPSRSTSRQYLKTTYSMCAKIMSCTSVGMFRCCVYNMCVCIYIYI